MFILLDGIDGMNHLDWILYMLNQVRINDRRRITITKVFLDQYTHIKGQDLYINQLFRLIIQGVDAGR